MPHGARFDLIALALGYALGLGLFIGHLLATTGA